MTIWITVDCFYEAKEPVVPSANVVIEAIERESAKTMVWLWHDHATDLGDITDKEVALLWKKFQANPATDDLAVTMIRRRVSMLWREYLATN